MVFSHALFAVLFCATSVDTTVTIPLENIWGCHRNLRDLEPEFFLKRDTPEKRAEYSTPEKLQEILDKAEQSLTLPIERAMQKQVLNQKKSDDPDDWLPAPGFAVVGRDREALKEVHSVVVLGNKPLHKFTHADEISIVFFALRANGLRLFKAERTGNKISIFYGFVFTGSLVSKWNISMIPVGKLPPGAYEVDYVHSLPLETLEQGKGEYKNISGGKARREVEIICRDFTFLITE